jgi:hypothetical protein
MLDEHPVMELVTNFARLAASSPVEVVLTQRGSSAHAAPRPVPNDLRP